MTNQARSTLNESVPMDPAIIADPYPRYQQLREEDQVHWHQCIDSWMLTRYTDFLAALRDQSLPSDQISSFSERLPESTAEKVLSMIGLISDMLMRIPTHPVRRHG